MLSWDSELGPQKFLAVKGGRTGAPLKGLGVWGRGPTLYLHDPIEDDDDDDDTL